MKTLRFWWTAMLLSAPLFSAHTEQAVAGRLPTYPEVPEGPVLREPLHGPDIVDFLPPDSRFSILGECGDTIVVLWEDDAPSENEGTLHAAGHHAGHAHYLYGVDQASGAVRWRRDGGWSSSRVIRTEGGDFWHIQQSCQIAVFAVKRSTSDGAVKLAIDLTALPPPKSSPLTGFISDFHAAFNGEGSACPLSRHLHVPSGTQAKGVSKSRPRAPEKNTKPACDFNEGLFLEDAAHVDGTTWLHISAPPAIERRYSYLCASDFSRGIWAWYSLTGDRFRETSSLSADEEDAGKSPPSWGKPKDPYQDVPMPFPDRQVCGDDGRRFQIESVPVETTRKDGIRDVDLALGLTPVVAGRLDRSNRIIRQASPPPDIPDPFRRFFAWPPHVVTIWATRQQGQNMCIYADLLSLSGDLLKRVGPVKIARWSEPIMFAAHEDRAVFGIAQALFRVRRSTSMDRSIEMTCERLSTIPIMLHRWQDVALKDLRANRDRIYAAVRLRRDEEPREQRQSYVVCWSAESGTSVWAVELK